MGRHLGHEIPVEVEQQKKKRKGNHPKPVLPPDQQATIKTDGLNNSNHWGFVSLVPSGNTITVISNVGRTDGQTSQGDIRENTVTVID